MFIDQIKAKEMQEPTCTNFNSKDLNMPCQEVSNEKNHGIIFIRAKRQSKKQHHKPKPDFRWKQLRKKVIEFTSSTM